MSRQIQLVIKRIIDVAASLVLLVPVFLIAALYAPWALIADNMGPLYSQERVGYQGRTFTIYKFQTVHPASQRVSSVGMFMRRFGVDELPQLINVLLGHMSFVGPRPLPRSVEAGRYGVNVEWRRCMRPGLVCFYGLHIHLGQRGDEVEVESKLDYQAIGLDQEYVYQWSLRKDARVLGAALRTARQMITSAR